MNTYVLYSDYIYINLFTQHAHLYQLLVYKLSIIDEHHLDSKWVNVLFVHIILCSIY